MDWMLGLAAEGGTIKIFPEPMTIVWTMLNFAILLWALHRFLYKPLLGAISAREAEIEGAIRKSREDREEAERLRREFEAQVATAQREAHDILNKATKAATVAKEQIETDARTKAAELIESAGKAIEREKIRAIAELREEVATLAISVASKVIEKNLNNDEQKRLADKFVAEVGKH